MKKPRTKPSKRSRASAEPQPRTRGPSEKKHKSLAEVRQTGRQSDQGGRPGRSARSDQKR